MPSLSFQSRLYCLCSYKSVPLWCYRSATKHNYNCFSRATFSNNLLELAYIYYRQDALPCANFPPWNDLVFMNKSSSKRNLKSKLKSWKRIGYEIKITNHQKKISNHDLKYFKFKSSPSLAMVNFVNCELHRRRHITVIDRLSYYIHTYI